MAVHSASDRVTDEGIMEQGYFPQWSKLGSLHGCLRSQLLTLVDRVKTQGSGSSLQFNGRFFFNRPEFSFYITLLLSNASIVISVCSIWKLLLAIRGIFLATSQHVLLYLLGAVSRQSLQLQQTLFLRVRVDLKDTSLQEYSHFEISSLSEPQTQCTFKRHIQ